MASVKSEEEEWGEHVNRLEKVKLEFLSMFEEKKQSLESEIYVLEDKGRQRVANFEKFMASVKEELETKIVMNDLDGPIWEDDDGASMFEQ